MKKSVSSILMMAACLAFAQFAGAADDGYAKAAAKAAEKHPPAAVSATPEKVVYDSETAFAFLKSMTGDWKRGATADHEHGGTGKAVTFRASAAGSSVVETLYPGEANEMVSMFHRNGDELIMTHYCALQNAPVMKFQKTDKPGVIKFTFSGGTNFDPKVDAHVHEGEFVIRDKDHVESNFVTFANDKPRPQTPAILVRSEGAAKEPTISTK